MNEFIQIFKKVEGFHMLKHYAKLRILPYAIAETVMQGLNKKSLEIVRLSVNNKIYRKLYRKNKAFIDQYVSSHSQEIVDTEHPSVIWICWMQGINNAPEIVKKCVQSVRENFVDKEIIIITAENYQQYTSFPKHIIDKYDAGILSNTQFSDLLRLDLLTKHGGTWIDATVFCSGFNSERFGYYMDSDLFMYQCLKPGLDGQCTSISSWFITASSNQRILLLARDLLYQYWKNNDYAADYFILHYFIQMAIEAYPDDWQKVVPISNAMPHVLLLRLFEPYDESIWNAIKEVTPFHKLTYKYDISDENTRDTYFEHVIKGG